MISRQRLHQIRFPERNRARTAVHYAVKSGKLRPASELRCIDCDHPAAQYDHYLGYAFELRLDVQPVCVSCHAKRFRNRRIDYKEPKPKIPKPDYFCAQCGTKLTGSKKRWCSSRCRNKAIYPQRVEKHATWSREHYHKLHPTARWIDRRGPTCINGHPWSEQNTKLNERGHRSCRACARARWHKRKHLRTTSHSKRA